MSRVSKIDTQYLHQRYWVENGILRCECDNIHLKIILVDGFLKVLCDECSNPSEYLKRIMNRIKE